MTLKEKIKSYSFWVSLASAIVLILKVIGAKFGFNIDATLASDIITSVCSVLVITGIIVTPTSKANSDLELLNSKTSQNTIKENLSILSNNLKETAEKILSGTTQKTEDVTHLSEPTEETIAIEPITVADEPATTETVEVEETKEIKTNSVEPETETTKNEIVATVAEATIVEPIKVSTETAEVQSITKVIPTEAELKNVLASQKDIWAKNIDVYYQILLEEVKSLKPNE